ncbi:MAG: hypothetical protein NC299_13330 [Lachnospiraceae bacterium]|nr:hypothetical protein [Ruminococcus sp.]MCM1276318.1 hypothetical protein [Lachnospiraceae bacterium]
MKIDKEIIEVLAKSNIDGNTLEITQQLDRALYLKVNKVLKAIGGKWVSAKKRHVFDGNVEDIVQNIILTGEYTDARAEFQFFPTPDELARQLVEEAEICFGEACLEPSAGRGNIAKFMSDCDCIELNPDNRKFLTENGFNVIAEDFMTFEPQRDYDVIVMNPPFCRQQDIAHVTKAISIAKRCVIAVMSASVMWRTDKRTTEFRALVESFGGAVEQLPEKAFKGSGTMVNTCKVAVRKDGDGNG